MSSAGEDDLGILDGQVPKGSRRPRWAWEAGILVILAVHLVYGALHASDYGQSWDDPEDANYGQVVLHAYAGSTGHLQAGDEKYHGPAYLMASGVVVQLVTSAMPAWQAVDVRHALNFATFLVAVVAFYALSRRLLSPIESSLAALLFAYQPVLFGHGFINQKDVPFMAAFMVAMQLGLKICDRARWSHRPEDALDSGSGGPTLVRAFGEGWKSSPWGARAMFALLVVAAALVCVDLIWGRTILSWGEAVVSSAYRGEAWGPINTLFARVAMDAYKTPVESYLAKVQGAFGWIRLVGCYLATAAPVAVGLAIARQGGNGGGRLIRGAGRVLLAAIALGLALSIRVAGVLVGGLLSLALLVNLGRRSAPILVAYWAIALSVCFLTWPYLWDAPVVRFMESARVMANFPVHQVMFRGLTMGSDDLPWDYLPTLFSVQLTEPALLLALIGVVGLVGTWRGRPAARPFLGVLTAWLTIPLLASMVLRIPLYSNFRQVLFAAPPLFILAGLGISAFWVKVRHPLLRAGFAIAVLAPGVLGIARLSPYEYIYYNGLIGGTKGAEGLFPHDYWCTSYRAAMQWVNDNAPLGAKVAIHEPYGVAASFARKDLILTHAHEDPIAAYVLRCNNQGDFTLRNLQGFPVAHVVTRSGVVLSVVFQPQAGSAPGGNTTARVGLLASERRIDKGLDGRRTLMRSRDDGPWKDGNRIHGIVGR